MNDQDQIGAMEQDAGRMDDATMGSPKGGSTDPGDTTGPGRYGGAEAADTSPSSGHDPMSGPGANEGRDLGSQDAMSTHGGSSAGAGSGEVQ